MQSSGAGPIAILDCGLGNIGSIANMLRRLGVAHVVTADGAALHDAGAVILPGVGAFDRGMAQLRDRGLRGPLASAVERSVPLLGICLGMQLLARRSEEGEEPGLGLIDADVLRFDPTVVPNRRIPHMGWNRVEVQKAGLLPDDPGQRFYFVHSYAMVCDDERDVAATTTYGRPFVSAVERGAVTGVQFHPEKSHRFGLEVLRRFATRAGVEASA